MTTLNSTGDQRAKTMLLLDVEGTITAAGQNIKEKVEDYLQKLRKRVTIGLAGGSNISKTSQQTCPVSTRTDKRALDNQYDHVSSGMGLVAHKSDSLILKQQNLLDHEKKLQSFIDSCLKHMSKLSLPFKCGNFIELRTGLINSCPARRSYSQEEEEELNQLDKMHRYRENFVKELQHKLGSNNHAFSRTHMRWLLLMLLLFHFSALLMAKRNTNKDEVYFQISEPENLRYTFKARASKIGVPFTKTLENYPLVLVEPRDACSLVINKLEVKDNIALVERGGCSFLEKCIEIEKIGGIAMIVYDYDKLNDDNYIEMIDDNTSRNCSIPAVSLLGKDGHMIVQALLVLRLSGAVITIPVNTDLHKDSNPPWLNW